MRTREIETCVGESRNLSERFRTFTKEALFVCLEKTEDEYTRGNANCQHNFFFFFFFSQAMLALQCTVKSSRTIYYIEFYIENINIL